MAAENYIALYDYDRDPSPSFFAMNMDDFHEATMPRPYGDKFQTGLGLAVGDVDGPVTGRGIDEIVVHWPRGFAFFNWPDLDRDLVVYGLTGTGSDGHTGN